MKAAKRKKLEANGWKVGDAADFLGLSEEEAAYVDIKLRFCNSLKALRKERRLTQIQLADYLGTSQSRVAKMENGDPSVSIDLLVKSLLALGKDIGEIFCQKAA